MEDVHDDQLDGLQVVDDGDALLVDVVGGVVVLEPAGEPEPGAVGDVIITIFNETDDVEDPVVLLGGLRDPDAHLVARGYAEGLDVLSQGDGVRRTGLDDLLGTYEALYGNESA